MGQEHIVPYTTNKMLYFLSRAVNRRNRPSRPISTVHRIGRVFHVGWSKIRCTTPPYTGPTTAVYVSICCACHSPAQWHGIILLSTTYLPVSCRSFVITALACRIKNQRGHLVCWISTSRKNGFNVMNTHISYQVRTSWASQVTSREVDWPCPAQIYVFGCDFWTRY